MSALFDGQRVIGPARDIQEVRNAITAYDAPPFVAYQLETFGDWFGDRWPACILHQSTDPEGSQH